MQKLTVAVVVGGAAVAAALLGRTGSLWPLDWDSRPVRRNGHGTVDDLPSRIGRRDGVSDMPECLLCDG